MATAGVVAARKWRRTGFKARLAAFAFALALAACTPKALKLNAPAGSSVLSSVLPGVTGLVGADAQTAAIWANSLSRESPQRPSEAFLWALSACKGCGAAFQSAYFADQAGRPGVLPQILVPQVRREVRANRLLNFVTGLGAAVGGRINPSMFDNKVKGEIRSSLVKTIGASLNQGTQLNPQSAFSFDVFVPGTITASASANMGGESVPLEFALADIAPRWNLVLASESPWNGAAGDHGLVTLQLMKLLVEWQYLFGLESDGAGGAFGGLSAGLGDLPAGKPRPWDPRQAGASASPRIVSGVARIAYAPAAAVDMAKGTRESWSLREARADLNEQAQIWTAAARGFERLRPRNRGRVPKFFQAGGLFPNDAHQLALAFLLGQDALLKGPLLDESARRVRAAVEIPGTAPQPDAGLLANVRLLRSLITWRRALSDVSDTGLAPDTQRQMAEAPKALLRAGQLVVQAIMLGSVERDASGNTRILRDRVSQIEASPGECAEALATLVEANREGFQSPYLDGKLNDALSTYRNRWLASPQAMQGMAAVDLVWLRVLAEQAGASPLVAAAQPWLAEVQAALRTAFAGVDGGP